MGGSGENGYNSDRSEFPCRLAYRRWKLPCHHPYWSGEIVGFSWSLLNIFVLGSLTHLQGEGLQGCASAGVKARCRIASRNPDAYSILFTPPPPMPPRHCRLPTTLPVWIWRRLCHKRWLKQHSGQPARLWQQNGKNFIKALITDLYQNLISGRDTEPDLSSSQPEQPYLLPDFSKISLVDTNDTSSLYEISSTHKINVNIYSRPDTLVIGHDYLNLPKSILPMFIKV